MSSKKSPYDRETEILYKAARRLNREWAAPVYVDEAKWGADEASQGKVTRMVTRAQQEYRAEVAAKLELRAYEVVKSYGIDINAPNGWENFARKLLESYVPECRVTTSREFAESKLFGQKRRRGAPRSSLGKAESYYRAVNMELAAMRKRSSAVRVAAESAINKVWKKWQPEFGKQPRTKDGAVTLYHRCKKRVEEAASSPFNRLMGVAYDPVVGWVSTLPPPDPALGDAINRALGHYEK
jgi:hypothetical protein